MIRREQATMFVDERGSRCLLCLPAISDRFNKFAVYISQDPCKYIATSTTANITALQNSQRQELSFFNMSPIVVEFYDRGLCLSKPTIAS